MQRIELLSRYIDPHKAAKKKAAGSFISASDRSSTVCSRDSFKNDDPINIKIKEIDDPMEAGRLEERGEMSNQFDREKVTVLTKEMRHTKQRLNELLSRCSILMATVEKSQSGIKRRISANPRQTCICDQSDVSFL